MRCQHCTRENPAGSAYCNGCGAPLAVGEQRRLDVVADGTVVRVFFGAPIASTDASRCWIAILDPAAPDSEYGTWQYVPDGATEVALPAPVRGGTYEVRLHADYP